MKKILLSTAILLGLAGTAHADIQIDRVSMLQMDPVLNEAAAEALRQPVGWERRVEVTANDMQKIIYAFKVVAETHGRLGVDGDGLPSGEIFASSDPADTVRTISTMIKAEPSNGRWSEIQLVVAGDRTDPGKLRIISQRLEREGVQVHVGPF
jgi:hypothetical protein